MKTLKTLALATIVVMVTVSGLYAQTAQTQSRSLYVVEKDDTLWQLRRVHGLDFF